MASCRVWFMAMLLLTMSSSSSSSLVPAAAPAPAPPLLQSTGSQTACIVQARGRGAGSPLSSCPNGTEATSEKNGLLCYKSCKDGYKGVGPVCWRSCTDGMVDLGTFCARTYGKGCCCTAFGCCHNKCRPGYKDTGCICRMSVVKSSYGRGAGVPLACDKNKEQNGGLCYKACDSGFEGQGPVCWQKKSPDGFPVRCNAMLWAKDDSTCSDINSQLAQLGGFTAACISVGVAVVGAGLAALSPLMGLLCGKSFDSLVAQVQQVIQSTHAKACHVS